MTADDVQEPTSGTWRDIAEATYDFEAKEREGRWFALSELVAALVRET